MADEAVRTRDAMTIKVEMVFMRTGWHCSAALINEPADMTPETANVLVIGALEIAKASMLARRWGLNVGNVKFDPLVKDVEVPKVPGRAAGGKARAAKLSPEQRKAIAKKAAKARWKR